MANQTEPCQDGHDGPAIRNANETTTCAACGFTTTSEEWDELYGDDEDD